MITVEQIEREYALHTIKLPKTKGEHNIFSSCMTNRRLKSMMRAIFGEYANLHVKKAKFAKIRAERYQNLYEAQLDKAAKRTLGRKFEVSDYQISGIGRNEFSDAEKEKLRKYLRLAQRYARVAQAHQACA